MTLTFFTARSTLVAHTFEWGKLLQCHSKGKTCSKLANGLNLYDLKKKLTPEVALTLPLGYIHVNYHLVKQVYSYISQVSGERLQDHWSSGFKISSIMIIISKNKFYTTTFAEMHFRLTFKKKIQLGLTFCESIQFQKNAIIS